MDRNRVIKILDKTIEWALYLLIFSVPFSKTAIEGCITVAFIAWISKKIITRDFKLKKTPVNNLLFAFFLIALVSFVNADLKLLFMRSIVSKCLKFIFLYFIVVESVDTERKLTNLLKMAFISAIIVMVDGYIQRYVYNVDLIRLYPAFKSRPIGHYMGFTRGAPTGPFPFPNDLSAWMLVFLLPVLSLMIRGARKVGARLILGSFLVPFSFLFYLTKVKSAWLGFFAAFICVFFIGNKKLSIALLIAVLAVTALLPVFLPDEKLDSIFSISSSSDRLNMWRVGWKIFAEHPIIGSGLNMGFSKFQEYREDVFQGKRGSYLHNGFLQIAAEIGIIGLAVFLLIIIKVFIASISYIRKMPGTFSGALCSGVAGGVLAFLIHSFFDTNLQSLPLVTLFWFSMAFLVCLQEVYAAKI